MTILEQYPLHRCIFKNDSKALQELLADEELQKRINEHDNHGNSPLHLALMLNRHNCIIILLKYNCDVFTRNNFGWNPIDEASMIGDVDVIEKITYRKWQEYINALIKPGGFLDEWNETTPNLYLKYKIKIKTTLPFLKRFGAKDYGALYKKGKNIRYDTTIGGIDTRGLPKIIRKDMSLYYLYEESEGINKMYLVDHTNKHYQEFFPKMPHWFLTNSLNSKMGANTIYKILVDYSKYTVKLKKGNILTKNSKTFKMDNGKIYKCSPYRGKNFGTIIRKRTDEGLIGTCESIIKNDSKTSNDHQNKSSNSTTSSLSSKVNLENDNDSDSSLDDSDDEVEINANNSEELNFNSKEDRVYSLYKEHFENGKEKNNKVTYTIDEDGRTRTFERNMTMEDTLDWEQAFHEKYGQKNDFLYNLIDGKKDKTKLKNLTFDEIEKLNLKEITEDVYFNPSSTGDLHLGRVMNISEEKRHSKYDIKYWMVRDDSFPLNIYDLKPLLKFYLSVLLDQIQSNETSCDIDKKLYEYFSHDMYEDFYKEKIFPLKMSIPIISSIALQFTFTDVSKEQKLVPDDLFKIPSDYTESDVFFEYYHK